MIRIEVNGACGRDVSVYEVCQFSWTEPLGINQRMHGMIHFPDLVPPDTRVCCTRNCQYIIRAWAH
jgi:hypothetical protein